MATVRYEGGSSDGLTLTDVPTEFAEQSGRELGGTVATAPVERYQLRGVEDGEHVFEFVAGHRDWTKG